MKSIPKSDLPPTDNNEEKKKKLNCDWKIIAAIVGALLLIGIILAIFLSQGGNPPAEPLPIKGNKGSITIETDVIVKNNEEDGKED